MGQHRKTDLLAKVDAGAARLVERVVQGVELQGGNIHWLQDHDEEAMDSHIGVYDIKGVIVAKKVESRVSRAVDRFFKEARTVGSAIEKLIALPFIRALLEKEDVDIKKIEDGLEALNRGTTEDRIRFVMRQIDDDHKIKGLYNLLEKALEDKHIDQFEWDVILERAGV